MIDACFLMITLCYNNNPYIIEVDEHFQAMAPAASYRIQPVTCESCKTGYVFVFACSMSQGPVLKTKQQQNNNNNNNNRKKKICICDHCETNQATAEPCECSSLSLSLDHKLEYNCNTCLTLLSVRDSSHGIDEAICCYS